LSFPEHCGVKLFKLTFYEKALKMLQSMKSVDLYNFSFLSRTSIEQHSLDYVNRYGDPYYEELKARNVYHVDFDELQAPTSIYQVLSERANLSMG
jgi:hypothetical protein